MPNTDRPEPNAAPFDLRQLKTGWLFDDDGRQFPIVARSRRTVTIAYGPERISLKRARLERTGFDTAGNGTRFSVSTYLTETEREFA